MSDDLDAFDSEVVADLSMFPDEDAPLEVPPWRTTPTTEETDAYVAQCVQADQINWSFQ